MSIIFKSQHYNVLCNSIDKYLLYVMGLIASANRCSSFIGYKVNQHTKIIALNSEITISLSSYEIRLVFLCKNKAKKGYPRKNDINQTQNPNENGTQKLIRS